MVKGSLLGYDNDLDLARQSASMVPGLQHGDAVFAWPARWAAPEPQTLRQAMNDLGRGSVVVPAAHGDRFWKVGTQIETCSCSVAYSAGEKSVDRDLRMGKDNRMTG